MIIPRVQIIYNNINAQNKKQIEEVYKDAVKIVKEKFKINVYITVLFFTKEFKYSLSKETYGSWIPNLLAFDVSKLLKLDRRNQIVCILEEFCHCLLHSHDETIVGRKVAEIYNGIVWDEKKDKYQFHPKIKKC